MKQSAVQIIYPLMLGKSVNSEAERMWKETLWLSLRCYPTNCLRKTINTPTAQSIPRSTIKPGTSVI